MAGCFAAQAMAAARVATGILGWPPAQFWAATPAELVLAIEGRIGQAARPGEAPVDGATLARMMQEMPDADRR